MEPGGDLLNRRARLLGMVGIITAVVAILAFQTGQISAQPPQIPSVYSGSATADGDGVPDALTVTGRIRDYESEPVVVRGGRYEFLVVAPPDSTYIGGTITFHLNGIQAEETDIYFLTENTSLLVGRLDFDLTFPALPAPTPTPTPITIAPSVYSGTIVVAGAPVPEGALLMARVGEYESLPAVIAGQTFFNLVLISDDEALIGLPIEFVLNDVPSTALSPAEVFQPGAFRNVALIFIGIPTPTPTPTSTPTSTPPTPIPPTATVLPTSTRTPVPPIVTSTALPTATLAPATLTPRPISTATASPVLPTATRTPPTPLVSPVAAAAVASPTPGSSGGACSPSSGDTISSGGVTNLLFLLAAPALLAAYRGRRLRG